MKVLQAYSGDKTRVVWTETVKRIIHRYLEHRENRRALRNRSRDNKLMAPYEGNRWCDATERELLGDYIERESL